MASNLLSEKIPNEKWKTVNNFNDIYAISNMGRLASKKSGEWKVLSNINTKGGYFSVVLTNGKNKKSTRIHRLVYEAFVSEIPNGKKYHIHHLNGDKQDNRVENLALESAHAHSLIHSKENPHQIEGMIRYNKYIKTRKIIQRDLNGNFLNIFANGKDASDNTGVCHRNIMQVASKEPYNKKGFIRKQAGGYIWEFAN